MGISGHLAWLSGIIYSCSYVLSGGGLNNNTDVSFREITPTIGLCAKSNISSKFYE